MRRINGTILMATLLGAAPVLAADAVQELQVRYSEQGAERFEAAAGEALWNRAFVDAASGGQRSCATCHTADLRRDGKHAGTGKNIEPLAPSVNPARLTDIRKIEKWFRRNCTWTLGRECTAQEKSDLLAFMRAR